MKTKSLKFRHTYWTCIFTMVVCYIINESVDNPLQWYEIAFVPVLIAFCLFVLYMCLEFFIATCNHIKQLLTKAIQEDPEPELIQQLVCHGCFKPFDKPVYLYEGEKGYCTECSKLNDMLGERN